MDNLDSIIKDIHILYIEDEEEVRNTTNEILKIVFKRVSTAKDGLQALEMFKKNNDYDIIVTDINMPNMNGLELIEEIRKIDTKFPVSITTAHIENKFLLKSINLGVNGYITKPINTFNLIHTISNAVEGRYLRNKLEDINENLLKDLKRSSFELKTILNTQKNLIAIINHSNIYLLNDQFLEFLGKKSIDDLNSEISTLSDLFIQNEAKIIIDKNNLAESLNSIYTNHDNKILIEMKNKFNKEESFQLDISTYELDGTNYIFTFTNVTSFKEEADLLQHKVNHDNLTGLYNKKYFNEILISEIHRAIRYKHKFCLAIVDIDFFKVVNDTYGHDIGDEVLVSLSNTIKKFLRESDIVCRWGGEEFVLLLPETSALQVFNKLERLRILIKNKQLSSKIEEQITISCGIAEFIDKDTPDCIFKKADLALYEAKNTGRNKITIG